MIKFSPDQLSAGIPSFTVSFSDPSTQYASTGPQVTDKIVLQCIYICGKKGAYTPNHFRCTNSAWNGGNAYQQQIGKPHLTRMLRKENTAMRNWIIFTRITKELTFL